MKKILAVMLALLMFVGCLGISALAVTDSVTVSVSIADKGEIVAANVQIVVTDKDEDGVLTINDALCALHDAVYEGGAAAGYDSVMTEEYGLSLTKLWGDTSGVFGYYLNNASAWSLSDAVTDGDDLYAFIYKDTDNWSDAYSFFDVNSVSAKAGEDFTLTLCKAGYDAEWNPITVPVAGATVTINGEATEYKTDTEGKVTFAVDKADNYVISATASDGIIVPPVCVATIIESEDNIPEPGDDSAVVYFIILAIASLMGAALLTTRKHINEN